MKSNVYNMLEKFFNKSLIEIAEELNYDEDNILILEGDEIELRKKYPETYNNIMSCKHQRDSRTPIMYAQDLVSSWIFEDYMLEQLKSQNLNIELSGEDRKRKILNSRKVSSNSDFLVTMENKTAYVELANDYTGYWKKSKICDLRDDKYNHLKEQSKNTDFSLLLGIDICNSEFFLIDINNDKNLISYSQSHWVYHKPVYSINLKTIEYHNFTFENICKVLAEKTVKK